MAKLPDLVTVAYQKDLVDYPPLTSRIRFALDTNVLFLFEHHQVANHPDLVTAAYQKDLVTYPSAAELIDQCGKTALLDRLLTRLHKGGHKVSRTCPGLAGEYALLWMKHLLTGLHVSGHKVNTFCLGQDSCSIRLGCAFVT